MAQSVYPVGPAKKPSNNKNEFFIYLFFEDTRIKWRPAGDGVCNGGVDYKKYTRDIFSVIYYCFGGSTKVGTVTHRMDRKL